MTAEDRHGAFFFIVMAHVFLTSPTLTPDTAPIADHMTEADVLPASLRARSGHAASEPSQFPPISIFAHLARHPCSVAIKPMSSSSSWSARREIREENVPPAFCSQLIPRLLCVHRPPAYTRCSLYFPHLISTFIRKICHFKVIFCLTFIVRRVYSTCA